MRFEKTLLDKSAKALLAKAEDCFDLAKTQHDIADKQHEIAASQHHNADSLDSNADKLDALGHALEADAVELKGETEIIAARTRPRLLGSAETVPPKAASPKPPTIAK